MARDISTATKWGRLRSFDCSNQTQIIAQSTQCDTYGGEIESSWDCKYGRQDFDSAPSVLSRFDVRGYGS